MKFHVNDISGRIVKEDERYIVRDNDYLKQLMLSSTLLHPLSSTTGHHHEGQEEYYLFVNGEGTITVGEKVDRISAGDIIPIPDGEFHRVINTSTTQPLYFVCIFNGIRDV
tara:strand:- start:1144 stop:1476 length:333 start_codon:yes stop_codon:yes gene_type:complete